MSKRVKNSLYAECFSTRGRTAACSERISQMREYIYIHALSEACLPQAETVFIDDFEDNLDGAAYRQLK